MAVLPLLAVILFLACLLRGAIADGQGLQKMYQKSKPDQLPCIFKSPLSQKGEEYCRNNKKKFELFFPSGLSEHQKVTYCKDMKMNTSMETGMLDSCIYFIGEIVINYYGPDIKDLQKLYETSKPGELICYYDGSPCKMGEEFCSVRSKTCEPLFQHDATESEKVAFCDKLFRENTTEQGMLDVCVFFLGKLTMKKVAESCQQGTEFWNTASGKCDELFPTDATDDEKRRICQEVIKNNVTERHDSCTFALGLLGCPKNPVSSGDFINAWGISMTVIYVLTFGILVVVIFCYCNKLWCFSKTKKTKWSK